LGSLSLLGLVILDGVHINLLLLKKGYVPHLC